MGDIADAMIDGELCEGCGVYLEGEPPGHPRRCGDCQPPNPDKAPCPVCRKKIKLVGLADHMMAKHLGHRNKS